MASKFLNWLKHKEKNQQKNECKSFKKNGAGILIFCPNTNRFLLHCRGEAGSNSGQYGLFGGSIDLGENEAKKIKSPDQLVSDEAIKVFKKTAIRELYEESGYEGPLKLELINIVRDDKCKFQFYNFLGLVNQEFKVNPPKEFLKETDVEKSVWFTWKELLEIKPKHFGLKDIIKSWKNSNFA